MPFGHVAAAWSVGALLQPVLVVEGFTLFCGPADFDATLVIDGGEVVVLAHYSLGRSL